VGLATEARRPASQPPSAPSAAASSSWVNTAGTVNTGVVPVLRAAAEPATLWAAIRPQAGAKPTADTKASLQTLKAK